MLEIEFEARVGSFRLHPRLEAGPGVTVLFGHSGSGKSLTLRAVAGLLRPDAGRILLDGAPLFDRARRIDLPPQRRGVGLVLQSYALFPHLSARDNIAFGLGGLSAAQRRARVEELAASLHITDLLERRPSGISGGQAQRVALARALAPRPRLLLLDEPFSALDSAIRVGLRREIARLARELALTVLFVTHDLREAYNLADAVAVFDSGAVLQCGPRDDVFDRPRSARVAELTETRNIWTGCVTAIDADGATVAGERLTVRARALPQGVQVGDSVDVCIRPERIILTRPGRLPAEQARDTVVEGEIVDEVAHGASHTLYVRLPGSPASTGHDLEVDVASHPYQVMGVRGRRTWALALPREAVHLMGRG